MMKLAIILSMIFGFTVMVELQNLRQLDQHYREGLLNSDKFSTPFQRITRLFHKHGSSRKHVSIIGDVVNANGADKSEESHLVVESDSFGTIRIHSITTPIYYLCIGKDYKPRGVSQESLQEGSFDVATCKFKESFTDKYVQFKSVKYYSDSTNTGCLAFNKNGYGRKINRSKCGHKSTFFMERKSRIIIELHKNGTFRNKLLSLLKNDG